MRKAPTNRGLTRRTLGGMFWTSASTGIEFSIQILVTVLLARLLAPSDFGLVSAGGVFLGFCRIFAQLGVGPALIQRSKLGSRHIRTGFTISLLFGLVLAAVVILLAPVVSKFFRMPALVLVFYALAPAFVVRSLSLVAESLLRRDLRFRVLANIQIASFIIGDGIVAVTLAFFGFGPWALIIGQLADITFSSITLLILRPHSKRLSINRRAFKELIYFGSGLTLARIGNFFALRGDYMVVGRWLGAGALGFYSRAYALIATPANLFAGIGDQVLFPTMAKIQNEPQRLATAFRRGVVLISLITFPVSIAVFVLAPELVLFLFGPKWTPVIGPLQILALGMYFRTGYKMSGILARAKGTVINLALLQGLYAILVVGGAFIGQYFGITGIAVGVLFALIVHFLLMSQLSLSNLPKITRRDFLLAHLPSLNLSLAVFIVTFATAFMMRRIMVNAGALLFVTTLMTLLALFTLIRFFPKIFLGKDGIWWLQTLSKNFKQTLWQMRAKFSARDNTVTAKTPDEFL